MPWWRRRLPDQPLLDLYDRAAANAERSARLLAEILDEFPDHRERVEDLYGCEQDGDRLTHDIIHRLHLVPRRRLPLAAEDGHALATALDDIVDNAEQAGDWLVLYAVEAPMEQALGMASVLVDAAAQVTAAVATLRGLSDLREPLIEIHRLENDGDRLVRQATADLFATGVDPMVVIRWKDIFDSLEGAVDACETVAHILEGASLRRR